MPSLEHNAIVDMFRENPELVPRFLSRLGTALPPHGAVAVVEGALDQLVPIEFRADLVVELRGADERLAMAIVLEVQLGEDADKKYSWPVYITTLRARKRCSACVLVVTPYAKVARWAASPIEIGPGPSVVSPLVLGPSNVPHVTDPEEARREPELAVLSAWAHGNEPDGLAVVMAALAGLERFDPVTSDVYLQIIYEALREPMRKALEAIIMERQQVGEVTLPPFAQWIKEQGKVEGLHEVLFELIALAGITLDGEQRTRIETCRDLDILKRWIGNALTAKTAIELLG